MTQYRLHFIAPGNRAQKLFAAVERTFEVDGHPLAMLEVDETKNLHEISIYTSDPRGDHQRLSALFAHGEAFEIESEELPDIDWVKKSLEGLKPVRAGRYLVHGSHDRDSVRPGDIAVEIDAGQAFGTGHHGTTSGCLTMIATILKREHPRNVLDLGTGSAVLAIALAKTAPVAIIATDIDGVATKVAESNVRSNGVHASVSTITANGFGSRQVAQKAPFDLIIANILAGPLKRLAPAMARHLKPGGTVILSGILAHQRRAVLAAYVNQHFRHVLTNCCDEWVTMQLKR
ncbi:MAG: 50S ribosomal protein L11 methyltransferase [Rhizobiaceae bacterium]